MSQTPSPAIAGTTPSAVFDALAPLRFPLDLRLTPEQFELLSAENREAVLELAADGRVIWMPPVGGETSLQNAALSFQIAQFAHQAPGWIAFASCAGFRLPDGSVLSPDASLVRLDRWQTLTPEQRRSFAPLCPDLVVELASPSEAGPSDEGPRGLGALRQKMELYRRNGAQLGWLLLPAEQAVEIWHGDASNPPERLQPATTLDAGALFPGLSIELAEVWAG